MKTASGRDIDDIQETRTETKAIEPDYSKANIIEAKGFWRWLLKRCGFAGITMPWQTVYILREYLHNKSLIRHELVHIEQIQRDGAVMFSARYLWWCLRYGYLANPYEREAYGKEPITAEGD